VTEVTETTETWDTDGTDGTQKPTTPNSSNQEQKEQEKRLKKERKEKKEQRKETRKKRKAKRAQKELSRSDDTTDEEHAKPSNGALKLATEEAASEGKGDLEMQDIMALASPHSQKELEDELEALNSTSESLRFSVVSESLMKVRK
jgi:hypothetical protein